jgi:hypothetical protein
MGVDQIIADVAGAVRTWSELVKRLKFPTREINLMKNAFRVVDLNKANMQGD